MMPPLSPRTSTMRHCMRCVKPSFFPFRRSRYGDVCTRGNRCQWGKEYTMGLLPPRKEKQSHSELGRQGETFVISRLMQVGYTVLVPVDGVQRYDLVIEDANQQFWCIQCKTVRYKQDVLSLSVRKAGKYTYQGSVDFFAAYCRELQKVYLIPVTDVGVNECWLRLEPTKNERRGGRAGR